MKTLLCLENHCYRLSKTLLELSDHSNPGCPWVSSHDWLHLASSIQSINVVTEQFNEGIMYCGPSIERENAYSKTLEPFVKCLTIFNFIWNGLEVISKIIDPPKIPNTLKKRRNGIDDLVFFLKNNYTRDTPLEQYNELLNELIKILNKDSDSNIDFRHIDESKYLSNAGKALAIIKLIRNNFAHGSTSLPEPDEYTGAIFGDRNTIFTETDYLRKVCISSRLLLLSIQMILISHYKDNSFEVLNHANFHEEEYQDLLKMLFSIHLQNK